MTSAPTRCDHRLPRSWIGRRVIGLDDAPDQGMANDIGGRETHLSDARDSVE